MERFAITHLQKDGLRALAFANQGRNHYDTKEQADTALEAMRASLQSTLGMVALEVRPVDCYEHGDAKGIYFPMELYPVEGMRFTAICSVCDKPFTACNPESAYGPVYADLHGEPWKAYYCGPCSKTARDLQEVTSGTR